jgi:hypothetical protein
MVQGKKASDMSNGTSKYQTNMSNQRKDMFDSRGGGGKAQNGEPGLYLEFDHANFLRKCYLF